MIAIRDILPEIRKRPWGYGALWTLGVLYLLAIFGGFLAPYPSSTQNLNKAFHPPTVLKIDRDGLYVNRFSQDLKHPERFLVDEDSRISVSLFAKGHPYKLLCLIPMERHFLLLRSENPDDRLYLLGSDPMGRDVFSRLLYGAQISLSIGLIGISITMVLGFIVGGLAGYFGGKFDFFAMRLVELLMAIPGIYLLLALRSALAPYFSSEKMYLAIVVILGVIGWSGTARIIRGLSLSLSRREFVMASRAMGQSTFKILTKHLLPNIMSYLLVAATLSIPGYILGEAALSFLGLGIQEPASSWGLMLKQTQQMKVFMLNYWWMLSPGVLIVITVVAFNVLGDTLRDVVDPKDSK